MQLKKLIVLHQNIIVKLWLFDIEYSISSNRRRLQIVAGALSEINAALE